MKRERELFKRLISKDEIVVDIGAHIGLHTLLFARLVGDKGQVFAFEPHPRHFDLLKKNIEINNYHNVSVENKAVSDVSGKSSFYCHTDFSPGSSIFERKDDCVEKIEIDTITLDDYFKNFNNKIDFIKIDVEGVELKVLKGLETVLKNNDNLKILIEYSPNCMKSYNVDPNDNMKFLSEHGFHFSDPNIDATKFFDNIHLGNAYKKNKQVINFLCVKKQKISPNS